MLGALLNRIRQEATSCDRLVFLGDLIGRGSQTRGVLDLLIEQRDQFPGDVHILRGNHESALLHSLAAQDDTAFLVWVDMMGLTTVLSYTSDVSRAAFTREFPARHLELLENAGLYYEDE